MKTPIVAGLAMAVAVGAVFVYEKTTHHCLAGKACVGILQSHDEPILVENPTLELHFGNNPQHHKVHQTSDNNAARESTRFKQITIAKNKDKPIVYPLYDPSQSSKEYDVEILMDDGTKQTKMKVTQTSAADGEYETVFTVDGGKTLNCYPELTNMCEDKERKMKVIGVQVLKKGTSSVVNRHCMHEPQADPCQAAMSDEDKKAKISLKFDLLDH